MPIPCPPPSTGPTGRAWTDILPRAERGQARNRGSSRRALRCPDGPTVARGRRRVRDPVIRRRIAWCWSKVKIMRYLGYRVLTGWLKGAQPGPEASISKLFWSEYQHQGMHAQVPVGRPPLLTYRTDDPGAANSSGSWSTTCQIAFSGTIYAGTSQVQRNILARPGHPGGYRALRVSHSSESYASLAGSGVVAGSSWIMSSGRIRSGSLPNRA
ncbi:acyl-CoA dehydrogenase family protein [Streptomyces sp. NPDC059373]